MLKYKIDVLKSLKKKGYTTYKLRKEKIFSEVTINKFRKSDVAIKLLSLETLCKLLNCQPNDIIEYVKE